MPLDPSLHEENRIAWNAATDAHNSHKRDQAAFFRNGGDTLFPEEVELLGDLSGKRLLHLQCNAGQDTLSLVRRGAVATGVDISDTAIAFARRLSAESGIPAEFARSDVFDWFAGAVAAGERYDIVFCSYGVTGWLSDLAGWAAGIASVLKPGGRFVYVDFHPFSMILSESWRPDHSYFGDGEPITWDDGIGDYVALSGDALTPSGFEPGVENFVNPHRAHEFAWGLGTLITVLLDAGLALTTLREYPFSNGAKLFDDMRETPGRRMMPPEGFPSVPLMFAIAARKPK